MEENADNDGTGNPKKWWKLFGCSILPFVVAALIVINLKVYVGNVLTPPPPQKMGKGEKQTNEKKRLSVYDIFDTGQVFRDEVFMN